MNRVIHLLADGDVVVDETAVPYLIFEVAETDLRKVSLTSTTLDAAWVMRTMHTVAVGLKQLHSKEIAHQDLKPSNVLFVQGGKGKLGDFGRSATKDCTLPHMEYSVAGDASHAPPEGLYGYTHPDWKHRRFGCDSYQLGSLMVFMLTGVTLTAWMQEALADQHRRFKWSGNYHQVLPYLIDAFGRVVDHLREFVPSDISDPVCQLVRELADPDIDQRGDPYQRRIGANPFMMERYVSRFDHLAKSLEYKLTRNSA